MTNEPTRATQYAMAYVNRSRDEPSDDGLLLALNGCCRPPKVEELPAIRAAVLAWRTETGLRSRFGDDGTTYTPDTL